MKTRIFTSKILELVDEGVVSRDTMLRMCLEWMSEASVKEMYEHHNIGMWFGNDDEDDEDSQGSEKD